MATNDSKDEILLDVRGLTKSFVAKTTFFGRPTSYVQAVDDVSFQIHKGECFGLVGESGCGKSTIGKMIVGLLRPTKGEIWFEGKNITALSEKERRAYCKDIQLIFQDPYASLNPRMTIGNIIAEPIRTNNILPDDQVEKRVDELLECVGLAPYMRNRYPHEFSGGQRQRVGIARALAVNPKLIVCDEPVSALDASIQAQILNLLRSLQKELGVTYLFIAHGLGAVHYISDEIAVMYLGRIVETGEGQEVFHHPAHPYAQLLIQAVPSMDPKKRGQITVPDGEVPSAIDLPEGCRFAERCPYATQKCRSREPELLQVPGGAPGHLAACWHPIGGKNPGEEA